MPPFPPNQPFCSPQQAGFNKGPGRIEEYLAQVLKLGPAEIHSVGIGMQATPTAAAPATDTYRVPSDQDLVVFSLHGYLQFTTLNTEPQVILGFLNLDPSERWFVKAQNCNVKLEDTDRNLQVFDARDLPMSAITPPVGAPMYFPPDVPYIIGAGHSLTATFTLNDTTTAIVGSANKYGILLTGALIPKRR